MLDCLTVDEMSGAGRSKKILEKIKKVVDKWRGGDYNKGIKANRAHSPKEWKQ